MVKIHVVPQVWAKATDSDHTFLESRDPEVTKNPYYVLPPEGSKKGYQLMDYWYLNNCWYLPVQS